MIRRLLVRDPRVFDLARALARRCGRRTALHSLLDRVLPRSAPVTFLQAGAHDGVTNDPYREFILRPNFRGVLVEPVPGTFRRLLQAYRHRSGLAFESCLVAYPPGNAVSFYTFDEDFLRDRGDAGQLSMLASTDRARLLSGLAPGDPADGHVVETRVPGHTIEELMARHGFASFDCLFLDIEGYEARVLAAVDLDALQTKLIAFESLHLGAERPAIEARLARAGFALWDVGQEVVAVRAPWSARLEGMPQKRA